MPQNQTGYKILLYGGGGYLGEYTKFSGGKVTAGTVMDREPGKPYPTASGGDKTIEAVTISRRGRRERDDDGYRAGLRRLVGVEDAMTVNVHPLDADGNAYGSGDTYVGTLTGYTPTPTDSNSTNEPAVFEVEIQPSNVS